VADFHRLPEHPKAFTSNNGAEGRETSLPQNLPGSTGISFYNRAETRCQKFDRFKKREEKAVERNAGVGIPLAEEN
jgi:hypothetical protein